MIINHNITALNTHNKLSSATAAQGKSMEKLASGLRINKAGDDAAGLAISEKMRSQVRGLDQASRNAQDGISMIQTAEGALNETHDILQRMRELSVQASNDTNNADDRTEIQKEMNQLTSEVSRIGNNTEFNTQKLLNGNKEGSLTNLAATAGTVTGAVSPGAAVAGDAGNLVFKVDGGASKTATIATSDTLAAVVGKINTAAGSTIASIDSGKLKLTSGTTGTSSSISIDASSTAASLSYLGLTATTATGAAASVKEGAASLQIGANQSQQFTVTINDMRASALGIAGTAAGAASGKDGGVSGASFVGASAANTLSDVSTAGETALDISDATKASAATKVLDQAIKNVSSERSRLGAYQNRLEHTTNNLKTSSENLTAAESRIRDVDMAKEMMNQTKNSILGQAAQAMLAQSNQTPQGVLQLLR
ncbi:flagellin N-terminal helical domain-containing protein [Exiguobacterium artemiae]|uniref:flagellin N-terminal helical domain-containing protein n=1 Tax=Exiguobacterium artemiae TaxID=340145 RepID=UPI0029644C15|nr:flagellin [Exiguobacterium sibiricum]MDW2884382.1 flagellin [Exiguobacterium sibiricum]